LVWHSFYFFASGPLRFGLAFFRHWATAFYTTGTFRFGSAFPFSSLLELSGSVWHFFFFFASGPLRFGLTFLLLLLRLWTSHVWFSISFLFAPDLSGLFWYTFFFVSFLSALVWHSFAFSTGSILVGLAFLILCIFPCFLIVTEPSNFVLVCSYSHPNFLGLVWFFSLDNSDLVWFGTPIPLARFWTYEEYY
jgi:hypothetical protein